MLHKDYDRKGSVEKNKKIDGRDSQGAWRQDELIVSSSVEWRDLK
jgi:hypothetical protein